MYAMELFNLLIVFHIYIINEMNSGKYFMRESELEQVTLSGL